MKMEQVSLRLVGRVQGVGFRWATSSEAKRLGLCGWVRNTAAGDVEIWAEGPGDKVKSFTLWCKQGPPAARVVEVVVLQQSEIDELSFTGFEIRR